MTSVSKPNAQMVKIAASRFSVRLKLEHERWFVSFKLGVIIALLRRWPVKEDLVKSNGSFQVSNIERYVKANDGDYSWQRYVGVHSVISFSVLKMKQDQYLAEAKQ